MDGDATRLVGGGIKLQGGHSSSPNVTLTPPPAAVCLCEATLKQMLVQLHFTSTVNKLFPSLILQNRIGCLFMEIWTNRTKTDSVCPVLLLMSVSTFS